MWKVPAHNVFRVQDRQGRTVAVCNSPEDARLIAEAPAMLALIERIAGYPDNSSENYKQKYADKVISNARTILARIEGKADE